MTPKVAYGAPARVTKPGPLVWDGRLPGPTRFRRSHVMGPEADPEGTPGRFRGGDGADVGGDFRDGMAAVIEREWLHPVVRVRGEVFQGVRAAVGPRVWDHLLRQPAAIECFA